MENVERLIEDDRPARFTSGLFRNRRQVCTPSALVVNKTVIERRRRCRRAWLGESSKGERRDEESGDTALHGQTPRFDRLLARRRAWPIAMQRMPPSATPQTVYCLSPPCRRAGQHDATGRSPGSRVLLRRLPARPAHTAQRRCHGVLPVAGGFGETVVTHPHSLTVAGAAGELRQAAAHPVPVSPGLLLKLGHLLRMSGVYFQAPPGRTRAVRSDFNRAVLSQRTSLPAFSRPTETPR